MGGLRTPCGAPPLPITAGADIRALAVDIEQLRNRAWMRRSIVDFCLERGQCTLTVLRKGGKLVTTPLAHALRGRATWPSVNAPL